MAIKKTILENGLTVATDNIDNFETVSLGLFVNVGSVNESNELCGISHFVEHMAFKGTETRTSLQISEAIESVGGFMNAFTSKEITAYYVKVLKGDLELAVDIIADIVQNSVFSMEEFEKERDVIIQEINQSNDTPDSLVFDLFQSQCFEDEKLGMPILGTVNNINSFAPRSLHDYVLNNYSSSKMIMTASGNVDHERFVHLVQQYTGKTKSFDTEGVETQKYKGGLIYKEKELEQMHIAIGFEGEAHAFPRRYDMMVLATIMGGGMSSRLFQEVREKRGLAYSVFAYQTNYRDTGVFGIYLGCDIKRAKEAVDVVNNEMAKIEAGISNEELARAKTQIKASYLMELESSSARMVRMANQHLLYGRFFSNSEVAEAIDNVSMDSILEVARRINGSKQTMAIVGKTEGIEDVCRGL
jgi:predicted Zn-dependent peptidase